jgi:hypothetical protein
MAGQYLGQRALPGSVRSHDRVHFSLVDVERDAAENLVLADTGVEVVD